MRAPEYQVEERDFTIKEADAARCDVTMNNYVFFKVTGGICLAVLVCTYPLAANGTPIVGWIAALAAAGLVFSALIAVTSYQAAADRGRDLSWPFIAAELAREQGLGVGARFRKDSLRAALIDRRRVWRAKGLQ